MPKLEQPRAQTTSTANWQVQLNRILDSSSPSAKVGLVGVGHSLRGDDYVGSFIAKEIMNGKGGKLRGGCYVFDFEDNVEGFISEIAPFGFKHVIFMDSCHMGLEPGEVDLRSIEETTYPYFTTHGIPLKVLAKQLLAKSRVSILAIQPKQTEFGDNLSPEVHEAAVTISKFLVSAMARGGTDLA